MSSRSLGEGGMLDILVVAQHFPCDHGQDPLTVIVVAMLHMPESGRSESLHVNGHLVIAP